MSTTPWPAQGATLSVDENNNNTYSLINNITSMTGFGGGSVTQARTTPLTGTVHTYRPTIRDPGEISVSVNFDPTDAVHKFLRNLADTPNQVGNNFKATWNTGNTNSNDIVVASIADFSGMDTDDVESNLTSEFTLKPTGANVWTAAT